MLSKQYMVGGAVLVGVLMVLTEYLGWGGSLNYVWALLVLVWAYLTWKA
jgi:hypothetical protein